jgi:serine phosphatase RsbU (regulator of sigma subunit)
MSAAHMSPINKLILPTLFTLLFAASCSDNQNEKSAIAGKSLSVNTPVDSLLLFANGSDDTFKVQALYSLCWVLRKNDPDSALVYGLRARDLADKLAYGHGLCRANNNLASTYRIIGEYEKALECNRLAYLYASQIGDSAQMGTSLGNLGTVYLTQGNYVPAMENFLQALAIAEHLKDSGSIAVDYGNIATVYIWQDKPDSAIRYFYKAMLIDKSLHDSAGIAFDLNGIAAAYGKSNRNDSALYYYYKVYDIERRSGTKYGLEKIVGNLGVGWTQRADSTIDLAIQRAYYDSAIYYFHWGIQLANELGDRRGTALNTGNLGRIFLNTHQNDSAEVLLNDAIRLCDSLGILEAKKDNEQSLSILYDSLGRYEEALRHFQIYIDNRDSLVNEEKSAQLTRAQMNFEFDKEKAVDQAKNAEVLARQQLMLNFAIGGGILLLIVAIVSIRAYRNKRRSGEIIAQQKREVENQKGLVDAKQKEIIDSINYAQRIQSAILPAQGELQNIFTESFVLFNPKDIVSGDFYWMAKTKDFTYIVAADCTGHGVPGGFMSMLGHSMLNEVILEKQISDTAEIMDLLRLKIIRSLKQTGESGENKDGMDMVLCRFSNDFRKLVFSCANNPLWICRPSTSSGQAEMIEFKPDKQPVGISPLAVPVQFRQHEFDLQPGDCVYMFTDGFADQFGGPKGKKFKYKALQELLVRNSGAPMKTQKEILQHAFTDWKGNLAQIDDVLVIGIKIQ